MKQRTGWSKVGVAAVCVAAVALAASPGLPNFQKVNDAVYRGGQPDQQGFKDLAAMGVKTVVDLRDVGEHNNALEQGYVTSYGMRYISIPMRGLSAPSDANVAKVLAIMNDPSAGPVFIHCRRGADRTGTVIACYRVSHDHWENRAALQEARTLGMSFIERGMQSYVMHYAPAAAPSATTATVQ